MRGMDDALYHQTHTHTNADTSCWKWLSKNFMCEIRTCTQNVGAHVQNMIGGHDDLVVSKAFLNGVKRGAEAPQETDVLLFKVLWWQIICVEVKLLLINQVYKNNDK